MGNPLTERESQMLFALDGRPLWVVDQETKCWIWNLSLLPNGYGQYKHTTAHRWVYQKLRGAIAKGKQLDHLCRVKACVNPDHLEPVIQAINIRRGLASKLTVGEVKELRKLVLVEGYTQTEAARQAGNVSTSMVGLIVRGDYWKDVVGEVQKPRRHGKFKNGISETVVGEAKRLHASGMKFEDIGKALGFSKSTAHKLVTGKRYRYD